jgi:AcrR family transcriptional regulator
MPPRGRRPAGSPDTRRSILTAARELFAAAGYERTTMREVAARAGVDPALIHHYFTNKDGLLSAAPPPPLDPAELLAGVADVPDRAGTELVRRLVGVWEGHPVVRKQMVAMVRTALSNDHATALLRAALTRTVVAAVQEAAAPDQRELRAALIVSHMGGLLLARYVLQVPGVADAAPNQLVDAVGPVVQHYLTGPLGAPV